MAVESASNVGSGSQVFKQLSGTNLEFRTLSDGSGVVLSQGVDDVTIAVAPTFPFTWNATHRFLGTTPEAANPDDPGIDQLSAKVSRTAPQGNAGEVQSAFLLAGTTAAATQSFEWLQLNFLDDFAGSGDNTPFYSKAYKHSTAPIWGGVFEVSNKGGDMSAAMYGIEVSLQSDGDDQAGKHVGVAVYYGSATTQAPAPASRQDAGIRIAPIFEQVNASLTYGVTVTGNALVGFAASANGQAALAAYGSYSVAAVDLTGTVSSPVGLAFGAGQRIKFTSGVGNGGNETWYSGTFVPTFVGALEILVDGSPLYIPVCSNRPPARRGR